MKLKEKKVKLKIFLKRYNFFCYEFTTPDTYKVVGMVVNESGFSLLWKADPHYPIPTHHNTVGVASRSLEL